MVDGFAKTPRYVLKDGVFPTSPNVVRATSETEISAIYGFSGKPAYDVFWKARSQPLIPFPLVKRFLQSQIDLDAKSLKLVVLDATSPQQEILQAATFQAIVEAFEHNAESVPVSHQLILDSTSAGYRVESLQNTALGQDTALGQGR